MLERGSGRGFPEQPQGCRRGGQQGRGRPGSHQGSAETSPNGARCPEGSGRDKPEPGTWYPALQVFRRLLPPRSTDASFLFPLHLWSNSTPKCYSRRIHSQGFQFYLIQHCKVCLYSFFLWFLLLLFFNTPVRDVFQAAPSGAKQSHHPADWLCGECVSMSQNSSRSYGYSRSKKKKKVPEITDIVVPGVKFVLFKKFSSHVAHFVSDQMLHWTKPKKETQLAKQPEITTLQ